MAIPFKYNRRSLLIRRVSNSMTVGAIAIVVGVFVAAMAIVGGLDSAIKDSSSPDNMILIGRGADTEANSIITLDQLDALKFLPAIQRDGEGNPIERITAISLRRSRMDIAAVFAATNPIATTATKPRNSASLMKIR